HAVGAGVAVGTGGLRLAGRGAAIRIADERVLDVAASDAAVRMPAAVLGAETARLIHVGRGEHEVDAVRVTGQAARGDGAGDDGLDSRIADARALRVVVGGRTGVGDGAAHVLVRPVV